MPSFCTNQDVEMQQTAENSFVVRHFPVQNCYISREGKDRPQKASPEKEGVSEDDGGVLSADTVSAEPLRRLTMGESTTERRFS